MAPVFLIGAGAYIYWRPIAFWIAARTIILLHFFYNALVFIGVPQNACIGELAEVMEPRGTADR